MQKSFLIFLLLAGLTTIIIACKTQKTAQASDKKTTAIVPEKFFYQSWLHAREEDKDNIKNYRPTDGSFQFPPSRGRYGFVFEEGGKGGMTYPGPTDATEVKPLTWKITEKSGTRFLELVVQDQAKTYTETYKIITLTDKVFQIEKIAQ